MPALIQHIDAMARKLQRDVLFVTFHSTDPEDIDGSMSADDYDWEFDAMRKNVTAWLTAHQIKWWNCAEIANENCLSAYFGQIYLDIVKDDSDPTYQLVRQYLEDDHGKRRFASVGFWHLPLAVAMRNVHHDEPGFWERWVETF